MRRRRASGANGQIRALALANMRYWPTVAPVVWRELERWRTAAREIGDPELAQLASAKLAEESFNAEVAATLATLAPRAQRERVLKAIVALEVLFDYLDGRSEPLDRAGERYAGAGRAGKHAIDAADPERGVLVEGERLFAALRNAVADGQPSAQSAQAEEHVGVERRPANGEQNRGRGRLASGDGEYLHSLSRFVQEQVSGLPSFGAVSGAAAAAGERCGAAQVRLHAAARIGDKQLERWARKSCVGSGLQWREYVAGCASSVLAMHALIATAARPGVSETEAQGIDAAYLAIGAAITTLDSLVDETQDAARGERGYIRLYDGREEIRQRLLALVREALARTDRARDGAHHAMTLAGVAAYYTTHPGADADGVRPIATAVREELSPTIWPALAVLRTWRAAKTARALLRGAGRQVRARAATGETPPSRG